MPTHLRYRCRKRRQVQLQLLLQYWYYSSTAVGRYGVLRMYLPHTDHRFYSDPRLSNCTPQPAPTLWDKLRTRYTCILTMNEVVFCLRVTYRRKAFSCRGIYRLFRYFISLSVTPSVAVCVVSVCVFSALSLIARAVRCTLYGRCQFPPTRDLTKRASLG